MVFPALPHVGGMMSLWEVRVQDFMTYAKESAVGIPAAPETWARPGFPQDSSHPVVLVSCAEAAAFCAWLTAKERAAGLIQPTHSYRLPTRLEFDAAMDSLPPGMTSSTAPQRNSPYPWGPAWPPPAGAGNFAPGTTPDHDDGHARTAPVGRFTPNSSGFHDLAGNVWEMLTRKPGEPAV
jgi:formylglycine-generating enzyme required for sulfatase activity